MSIIIKSDADASAYSRKTVTRVQQGLILDSIPNTSIQKVTNNFSLTPAGETWEAVGAPVVGAKGTVFKSQTNFVQTDISAPDNAFTLVMVARSTQTRAEIMLQGAEQCMLFGNYDSLGGVSGIAAGWTTATGNFNWSVPVRDAAGAVAMRSLPLAFTEDFSKMRLTVYRVDGAVRYQELRDVTAGEQTQRTEPEGSTYILNTPNKLRIGSSYRAQMGSSEISRVRLWNRYLSDTEVDIVVAEMRNYELTHNGRIV